MPPEPVILAVASPPGRAWRGIVRVSGAETFALLRSQVTTDQDAWRGGTAVRARVGPVGGFTSPIPPCSVPCMLLVFRGPRSYTGEDAAEIQLPGNPALLERVVDALIESGRARGIDARRAEAGEFTARAFLNGKMTLTEAEGVAAVISARSDAQLRAATLLASGRPGALARALADDVAGALALVEAGIDFTDQEDVVAIPPEDLAGRLASLRRRIARQLDRAVGAERLEAIPWVVLAGAPNAGKSTLFNALLGRPRAVVSEAAGTTRDVLAEPLAIETPAGPAEVMLVDLAGAADGDATPLDRAAQSAARDALARAELIVRCVPVDGEPPPRPPAPPEPADPGRELVVRTKGDLAPGAGPSVSARTGAGLDRLRDAIARRLADRVVSLAADALVLAPRQDAALRSARHHVDEALALVASGRGDRHLADPELVAAALRWALDDLGALAGEVPPDDVLGRIFATFCVGK